MNDPVASKSRLLIDYRLVGTGWSECRVASDASEVSVSASYLGDALGGLASATLKLLNGSARACCSFDEEPGEYRWVFEAASGMLSVRILEFQRLWSNAPDSEGTEIFRWSGAVLEFSAAVFVALSRVLSEEGVVGYKAKWAEHDFPLVAFRQIKEALAAHGVAT